VVVGLYAWWATGEAPFHLAAYLAVALPVVIGLAGSLRGRVLEGAAPAPRVRDVAGWVVLALGALVLEAVGLALGGRSPRVPTLSTTVDHLLVTHVVRAALFVLWVGAGAWISTFSRRRAS
jgi:hypothetical protein